MGVHRAEQRIEVAGPPDACFAAGVDYESFPRWQRAVKRAEVMSRNEEGLGEIVAFEIDAKVRRLAYTLRYGYEAPGRVWWELVEGDVADIEGEYRFEPKGDGTLVTYALGIDPGVPLPGLIAGRLNRQIMKQSVEDLRDEVERRAAQPPS